MRAYEETDLHTLNGWRAAHGLGSLKQEMLPKYGLVVDGVAAGFLFRTESPMLAMLDSFVTNPSCTPRARYLAVARIVNGLAIHAKAQGISGLLGATESRGIGKLMQRLGYAVRPATLVSREMT